jgi:hypothetical protein
LLTACSQCNRVFVRSLLPFVALASAVLLFDVSSARAQQSAMDAAAAQFADALAHSKQTSVIVFDFTGPDNRATALGQTLANSFSHSLATSAHGFMVMDRSSVDQTLADYRVTIASDPDLQLLSWLAQNLKVQASVAGRLSVDGDKLSVALSCSRASDAKNIKALQITIPLTDDQRALLANDILEIDNANNLETYPVGGKNGYSAPRCVYCPRPDVRSAAPLKIQGVVELVGIVGTDGRVHRLRVVKPLPGGLSSAAVEAVTKWRIAPATGPDGKPVAVREIFEVFFKIF